MIHAPHYIIVAPTQEAVRRFRERVISLSTISLDMNEIGAAVVDGWDAVEEDDAEGAWRARDKFAAAFARAHPEEYEHAFDIYSKFFDEITYAIEQALVRNYIPSRHFLFGLHSWLGDDMVMAAVPFPY